MLHTLAFDADAEKQHKVLREMDLSILPDDAFVFCCFNAAHKITRHTFARWMEIMRQTPNSVLWMLDYNTETNTRLRANAEELGVSGDRLYFAPKIQNARHLARYPLADLFLDTIPYGAHTTARYDAAPTTRSARNSSPSRCA